LLSRVAAYLREVRAELKKVVWPTRRETVVFTAVVLLSVAMSAAIIWVMDGILGTLLKVIISG